MIQREKRRLEFLDCLRGVAALMVVYLHVSRDAMTSLGLQSGWEHSLMYACTYIADFGKIGVVLFFAISGFIIPVSFSSSHRPALMFVVSRFFRLYPAYWVSLLLGVLVFFVWQGKTIPYTAVVANLTMLQTAMGQPDVLGVYWTLFIEWIFYVFCLAAFLTGRLGKTRFSFNTALGALAVALVFGVLRYATHRKVPIALAAALSIMIWASLWRNYLLDRDMLARKLAFVYLGIFVVVFPVITMLGYNFDTGFDETWYRYAISYLAGLAMFLLFTGVWRLRSKALVWLGGVSYSLYLLHPLVVVLLERWHGNRLPFGSAHLFVVEALVASLAAADLCYRFVEKPSIRLGQIVRSWVPKDHLRPEPVSAHVRATSI